MNVVESGALKSPQQKMDGSSTPNAKTRQEEPMEVSETSGGSNRMEKGDEDDDDVVIMDEEGPDQLATKETLSSISKAIENAKDVASETEEQIALMTKELENMQTSLSDAVYDSLRFLVDNPNCLVTLPVDENALEEMIADILKSMNIEEIADLTTEEYENMHEKLNLIEKANQSVSKMFLDCHAKLRQFRENIVSETVEMEKEIAEYEKCGSNSCLLIDSDDEDDDVAVIGTSVTGTPPSNARSPKSQRATSSQATSPRGSAQSSGSAPATMEQLRSQFVSAVNKSMPQLMSSLQSQQVSRAGGVQLAKAAVVHPPIKWPVLNIQDKVLGKKFNDVWYSGTVLDIYTPTPEEKEWRCKVKFDGKGLKILPGKHVAYREPINCFIRVGTRVVALYREDDAPNTFFAGVIAEAPSIKNNRRFLVFFDDGYAQYCDAKELHKVYMQSENVWEDINPETSAFIKEYLRIYPERPMVRLSKGQVVRTEWNGKWWTAKVQETDSSLVKMYFQADKRTEWIYRGSTRLEPLFKALANADAIKAAGSAKGRRHNLSTRPSGVSRPQVEYTRGVSEDDGASKLYQSTKPTARQADLIKKKSNVAKKSTGGAGNPGTAEPPKSGQWEAPWIRYQRKATPGAQRSRSTGSTDSASQETEKASGKDKAPAAVSNESRGNRESRDSSKDIASVLQERLAATNPEVEYDEEKATGERREVMLDAKDKVRKPYRSHQCSPDCLKDCDDDPDKYRGRNTLLIPLLCGWERQVCKVRPSTKRHVIYRSPCGRRLRNIEDVDKYLLITDSKLTIDFFSYDQQLHVNTEFVPVKTFCDIKDLSYGRENYPISCVNGIDRHYPDYVEYAGHRIPSKGVNLNVDPDFLVCCDCTDNCRDPSKCSCQQMTVENTTWIGDRDPEAGYHHRRLPEPLFTGIVECNSRCKCDKRCSNRVAQQGLRMRLQVFKTEKKGWGLRCLDDIAKGSFICIYAGQLLTDRGANEDGKQYGDEYLAELDFIEVVERQKEGYESDVEDMDFSDDDNDVNYKASKDSEEDSDYAHHGSPPDGSTRRGLRQRKKDKSDETDSKQKEQETKKKTEASSATPPTTTVEDPISISDDDEEDEENDNKTKSSTDTKEEKKSPPTGDGDVKKSKPRARKSTGGSRFNLSTTFKMSQEPVQEKEENSEKKERIPTRSFFQDDTECYIMDAKSMGNLGRYLNHSCTPNVFVQNIFVDTHDLRFPWVAFFAGQYIRAGTELTWDYNYEVGSVPDKVLYCYCGSPMCRGRLL